MDKLVKTAPEIRAGTEAMAEPRFWRWVPCLLALFFAAWGLRAVGANNIVDTDAARHAMNGVFIRDMIASGNIAHPMEYGKFYYGHLPALSLPYHPPLFPLIESIFFWIFGVNVLAARLAISLAAAISIFLIYRLIVSTHQSHWLAFLVTVTFGLWTESQYLASDVMLEFPAMAFTLGTLWLVRNLGNDNSRWRFLGFAVLAGAAVWTKQQTLFLGATPFLYAAAAGEWRMLLRKRLWIATAMFAIEVAALSALTIPFRGTGVDQAAIGYSTLGIFTHNFWFYVKVLNSLIGLLPALFVVGALLASVLVGSWRRRNALYIAWAAPAFGLLLLIVPFSSRYLFFVLPPLMVITYDVLAYISGTVIGRKWVWAAPAFAASVWCGTSIRMPAVFLRGPSEAAAAVVKGDARRVLYCGSTDGNFVFGVRALDPQMKTVVISGDKLPNTTFTTAEFDRFAMRYGISDIIIEQSSSPQSCDSLAAAPTPLMKFQRDIPLDSSFRRWKGTLKLYRFNGGTAGPAPSLKVEIPKIGGNVEVKF